MDIKRTFACAIIAMPLLVACNNDDKIGDDNQPAAAITLQDLAGDWNITLVTPSEISSESYFINHDGSYQYSYIYSPYEKEEDEYKPFYEYRDEGKYGPFVIGNLIVEDITMARERYALLVDDIEQARWDTIPENILTDTTRISFLCQGSVLCFEYFYDTPTLTSQDVERVYLYFKKGATNLPSDKSLLQGTWYSKDKDGVITMALRFSGDNVEIYDGALVRLYKGAYTYKDGIVSIGQNEMFAIDGGKNSINAADPFDSQWQTAQSLNVYNYKEKGISFAFIANDKTAYTVFFDQGYLFNKQ
jgi:hypothetical protein